MGGEVFDNMKIGIIPITKGLIVLLLTLYHTFLFSQLRVDLENPSFEDTSSLGKVPKGWFNIGFIGETPPDIHPKAKNSFQVSQPPRAGKTYIGLVTRDNKTWGSIGQTLSIPIVADQCYRFQLSLARSNNYQSFSRITEGKASYTSSIRIRV